MIISYSLRPSDSDTSDKFENANIQVLDALGKVVYSTQGVNMNGTNAVQVDLTLFLYSQLFLGNIIFMEIEDSEVALVIESIRHSIDYYGSVWDTKVIARSREAAPLNLKQDTDNIQDFSTTA